MPEVIIYHNPRCSKSRQTLELLKAGGHELCVILYLETPPTADQLAELLKKLGMEARQLLRRGEAEYKQNGLDNQALNEKELIDFMCRFPKLIERPIVVAGPHAVIGRPPEAVLGLF